MNVGWRSRHLKHATAATLETLGALLAELRTLPGMVERKPGIFYAKSSASKMAAPKLNAYLHFHEDPAGIFADVRLNGEEFDRFPVNTKREQEAFLKRVTKNRGA
jgi:hypothetical protein